MSQSAEGEPNLVPILDMVFQLVTFFILVMNFKAAVVDLKLQLPVLGAASPIETPATDVLVLNVDPEGKVTSYGQPQDLEKFVNVEAQVALSKAQVRNPDLKFGDELPTIVVIRADQATPFRVLNRVVTVCREVGLRNVQFRYTTNPGQGS
ncbi:MAG: biopolymer transporter ExbD [Pirellulales bacterium]|nr:biopolymer transporter ExbD [Pirellulales bacterium]